MFIGTEKEDTEKDDYYEIAVNAIEDEGLRDALLSLSEQDRKGLDTALDREGLSFGAFKGCDDSEAVVGALSEWQTAEGEVKKKTAKKLVGLLE